jgi:hypothetical protein
MVQHLRCSVMTGSLRSLLTNRLLYPMATSRLWRRMRWQWRSTSGKGWRTGDRGDWRARSTTTPYSSPAPLRTLC